MKYPSNKRQQMNGEPSRDVALEITIDVARQRGNGSRVPGTKSNSRMFAPQSSPAQAPSAPTTDSQAIETTVQSPCPLDDASLNAAPESRPPESQPLSTLRVDPVPKIRIVPLRYETNARRASGRLLLSSALLLAVMIVAIRWWWTTPRPQPSQEIYPGISYACETHVEGGSVGLAHVVSIDLNTPGLRLYVTPTDPAASSAGWQYFTRWVPSVVRQQNLAVAINGTLFTTNGFQRAFWPGQYALAGEIAVSDHEVNHRNPHSYLLWFEDDLTPHLELQKPPSEDALKQAKWGISGQGIALHQGKVSQWAGRSLDTRTMIGIDPDNRRLYLGVYTNASEFQSSASFARHGARDAIHLDGGSSSCLAFAPGTPGVSRPTVHYPQTSVATVFGVGFD